MGIFNFVKKTANNLRNTQSSKPELSVAEFLFLKYLSNHDTDISTFSKSFEYNYNLDYNKTINFLIDNEYVRIGSATESLVINTVSDLKFFLKEQGMATSGNKDILINRILTQTTGFDTFFQKRIYILTEKGSITIEKYEEKRISNLKKKISDTITHLYNKNYDQLVAMYEAKPDMRSPFSIGYNRENIIKDVKAINQYRSMSNITEYQLTIAILTTMFHITIKDIKKELSCIGYENIQDTEIYTISSSIRTLRTLLDFNESNIKRYSIDTCGDGRVCKKCQSLGGKTFLVNNAKIGDNAPPLCDHCRCRMKPIFSFE